MPKLTKEILVTFKPTEIKKEVFKEFYKCCNDGKYCIETYFSVVAGLKRIPFKLFPHQIDAFDSYEQFANNISMKSRQMGFTTFTSAYVAWKICTNNNYKVLIVSKHMKAAKEFLKTIKDILDEARKDAPWLVPEYLKGYNNKESFHLTNGSLVQAEATSEDTGRGIQGLSLIIADEVAFIDRKSPNKMKEIWASVSPALATTRGKAIMISTPKGASGWYYETYSNAKSLGFHIVDAHWTRHPIYSLGQYQWKLDPSKEEGGYLEFFGKAWPESLFDKESGTYLKIEKTQYNFILDGKIRSPWYDMESSKIGPRLTKCELDCSFAGTGGEVLDSDMLRQMKLYADKQKFYNPFKDLKGIFEEYREFHPYCDTDKYILSADVSTGDGSDFSTFTVFNLTKFRIEATYKGQIIPKSFAQLISTIGLRYGHCTALVENQGGGFTVLQELKDAHYGNIYYSTLNKKDPTTGMKKKKIGLWASEDVRAQGGDKLEEAIRLEELEIPCVRLIEEFNTWIWDKDGKRRHAPQRHDDLIISLQHAMWYTRYVFKRAVKNKKNFQNLFKKTDGVSTYSLTNEPHARGSIIITNTRRIKKSFETVDRVSVEGVDPNVCDRAIQNRKIRRMV